MHFLRTYQAWIIVFVAVLSRVPQLMSPLLLLDGDECIVGLMAKHFYEGKELPLYFYGQSYGFSLVEVLAIYPFYCLIGISGISVKLGMLCLWILGVVFFNNTLRNLQSDNPWLPPLFILVLVFAPSWAVCSMKAWGFYLTAFCLSSLTLYLITSAFLKPLHWIFVAVLVVLIYESQPLWLPGLYPFLMYYLLRERSWRPFLLFVIGSSVTLSILFLLKRNLTSVWPPPTFTFNENMVERAFSIPRLIYGNMTGSYYYSVLIDMGLATDFWAACFTGFIFLGLTAGLLFLIRKKEYPLLYVSCMAVMFNLGYLGLISSHSPRYLLPLTGSALIMFFELLKVVKNNYASAVFCGVLVIPGAISLIQFKDHRSELQDRSQLQQVLDYLAANDVRYVFCRQPLLDCQINFYSQEQIVARHETVHRYPEYCSRVNAAYRSHQPCAVIDSFDHSGSQESPNKHLIANTYLVHLNPTREEVREYGFDIGE